MILCGDFNSVPHSDLYNFVINGYLDLNYVNPKLASGQSEHMNKPVERVFLNPLIKQMLSNGNNTINHKFQMSSAYTYPTGNFAQRLLTTIEMNFKGAIDFIMYTNNNLKQNGYLSLPCGEDFTHGYFGGGLPNQYYHSDHFSLMAQFSFPASPGNSTSQITNVQIKMEMPDLE